jgi:hypothetical protein
MRLLFLDHYLDSQSLKTLQFLIGDEAVGTGLAPTKVL